MVNQNNLPDNSIQDTNLLKRRSAECVNRGGINMANKKTITEYFKVLLETWYVILLNSIPMIRLQRSQWRRIPMPSW